MNQDENETNDAYDLEMGISVAAVDVGFIAQEITEVTMFSNNTVLTSAENVEMIDSDTVLVQQLEPAENHLPLALLPVKDIEPGQFLKQMECEDLFDSRLDPKSAENMQLPILERICLISSQLTEAVKTKHEPITVMQKLNLHVWENLGQIAQELSNLNFELRQNVIKTAFTDLTMQLLKESIISKPEYLRQIAWFFRNIVSLYPLLLRDPAMCHCVEQIFVTYHQLYKSLENAGHMTHTMGSSTSTYYNSYRSSTQSLVDWINGESKVAMSETLEEDLKWRTNLQVGDYIDCIGSFQAKENVQKCSNIQGWQPAKILQSETEDLDFLVISFLRCSKAQDIKISRFDQKIQPFRTYTDDWDFRFEMKEGETFDCADEYGVWYRSTALKIDTVPNVFDCDGNTIMRVLVAFRYYTEFSQKQDQEGRYYFGYSEKFDKPHLLAACNIQKWDTCCYQYLNVGVKDMNYDMHVHQDILDTIYPSNAVHEWAVHRETKFAGLQFMADIINEFGKKGGFDNILTVLKEIADGSLQTSILHLLSIHSFIVNTMPLWSRQFVCQYSQKISAGFISTLTSPSGYCLNLCNSNGLASLIKSYQQLLSRYFTKEQIKHMENKVHMKIGGILLNQQNFLRRCEGIRFVTDQISVTRRLQFSNVQPELMEEIRNLNIFSLVFGPRLFHSQIVRRSQEILRIYVEQKQLTQVEIDMLWESAMIDQTSKHEIYQLFSDVTAIVRDVDDSVCILFDKIKFSLKPEDTDENDVTFIQTIGKNSGREARQKCVDLLWRIVFSEVTGYSNTLIKPTKKLITELLRNTDREIKESCIVKCIDIITRGVGFSYHAASMLVKLLETLPKITYNSLNQIGYALQQICLKDFVRDLCETQNLVEILLDSLEAYLQGNVQNQEQLWCVWRWGQYSTHKKNVQKRLKTVLYLQDVADSKTIITGAHVERVWDMLMLSNEAENTSIFFNFLKRILDNQEWCASNSLLVSHLFREKVLSNSARIMQNGIKEDAFLCIKAMFLHVNEYNNNLNITSRPLYGKNATEYQQKKELIFRVHVQPAELIGMDVIWESFRASCFGINSLQQNIGKFIALIYISTSSIVIEQKFKIFSNFTDQCFEQMQKVIATADIDELTKSELIKNTMTTLLGFFEDSEKLGGTAMIRPHQSIDSQGYFIEKILITNLISSSNNSLKHIVVSLPSKTTVWELFSFVASKINKSPLKIILRRGDKKPDLLPQTYSRSLRKMLFESGEEIIVVKANTTLSKVPLINPLTNKLVKDAEFIFQQWFNHYSVSAESIAAGLPEEQAVQVLKEQKYMTKETALLFLQNSLQDSRGPSLQTQNLQTDDKRIQAFFDEYDLDHDNRLTFKDYIKFYTEKSLLKPDVVWQNLQAHGIGHDLQLEPKDKEEVNFENDPALTKDSTKLPRSLISLNSEKLDLLFNLNVGDSRVEIQKLIGSLQTNPQIYAKIIEGDMSLFSPNQPVLKLLYCLQILKHLIKKYSSLKMTGTCKLYFERAKRIDQKSKSYKQDFPSLNQQSNNNQEENNSDTGEKLVFAGQEQTDWESYAAGSDVIPNYALCSDNKAGGIDNQFVDKKSDQNNYTKIASNLRTLPRREYNENLSMGANQYQEPEQSQAAIPLPSAQDVAMASEDKPQFQKDNSKLTYNMQQVLGWKGDIDEEILYSGEKQMTDDQMETWLPLFLTNGGFQALVNILSHFVSKVDWNSTERRCVRLTTQMIKIILVATFTASSTDQALVGCLQRKMSLSKEFDLAAEETQKKEANIGTKQEEVRAEFAPMTELILIQNIQSTNLLPQDPHMNDFSALLQKTFEVILSKSNDSTESDNAIVSECLNIWISEITFNADRLLTIYNDQSYIDRLVENGLLSNNNILREQFKEALLFVCLNIKQQGLPESPILYFLRVLISKLEKIATSFPPDFSAQYFSLLGELMGNYYHLKKTSPLVFKELFDPKQLTKFGLELLNEYDSSEKRNQSIDHTLVGLLKLLRCMLVYETEDLLTPVERAKVIKMIVEKCLFNQDQTGVDRHITQDIDIKSIEAATLNSCHSKASQEAAYKLFNAVIGANQDIHIVDGLIAKYWAPLILKLEKPRENDQHAERVRSQTGFAGIKNLGCICYMNAMIQQFYHVPSFRYSLLAACDDQPGNMVKMPDGRDVDDNSLHQWLRMFGFLELTDRPEVQPHDFCFAFKTGDRPVNVSVQQDAQEFLNIAFDKLENSLKDTPMKYLCQSVFSGQNTNLTVCKGCGNINKTEEDFYSISLQVKNKRNIYESLKNMVAGEQISGYKCSACKQTVDIEKKQTISKLPNTLIVHLNRIVFDFDQMRNVKLNDKFDFPNILNLQDYMLQNVLKEQKVEKIVQNENEQQMPQMEDGKENEEMVLAEDENPTLIANNLVQEDPNDYEFKLTGVVIHMGTADAGHYLSYINTERNMDGESPEWGETQKQRWLIFNDSNVDQFDFSDLESKCFGEIQFQRGSSIATSATYTVNQEITKQPQQQHNAYMLIYEKRRKLDIEIVIDQSSLVCDSTAITRGQHALIALPSLKEKLMQGQIKIQKNEPIVSIPFFGVHKFIPNKIYQQVNADNKLFLAEKQVFSNHFFETTYQLLSTLIMQSDKSETQIEQVYTLLDKVIFDLLMNTKEKWLLAKMVDLLLQIVDKNLFLLLKLVNERILKEVKLKNEIEQPFFDALIFSSDLDVRETMEQILTFATSLMFDCLDYPRSLDFQEDEIDEIQKVLDKVVKTALWMMPRKCQNAWHKVSSYFNHYYNILKGKAKSRLQYYKGVNLVSRLVDLISRLKEYKENGYYITQPIDNAVRTVSLLVRSQPLMCYLYKLHNDAQMTTDEIMSEIEKGVSPYHTPLEGNNFILLDAEDLKSLFMDDKNTKHFWDVCFRYSLTQEAKIELAQLIAHMSYKNYDFSRRMAKILLLGLNKTTADELTPYTTCMQVFLSIQDEYQQSRIEWLLGFPVIILQKPITTSQDWYRPNLQKVGVGKIQEIQDMVYEYKSFLFKEQSSMREALLLMIYNYRKGNFMEAAMFILEALLDTMSNRDGEGTILKYLLTVEGPAYTCKRYWDWIEPYLLQHIQDVCSSQINQHQMEQGFRMLQYVEKLKKEFAVLIDDTFTEIQPYLTWEILKTEEFTEQKYEKKSVCVLVQELTTRFSKSTPNPIDFTNKNLAKISRTGGWQSTFQQTSAVDTRKVNQRKEGQARKGFGRGKRGKQKSQVKIKTQHKVVNQNENAYYDDIDREDEDQVMNQAANQQESGFEIKVNYTEDGDTENFYEDLNKENEWKDHLNNIGEDIDFDPSTYNKINQQQPLQKNMTENEDIRLQCEDISQDEHVDFNPKYPDAADPDVQNVPIESDEENDEEVEDDTKKFDGNTILLFTVRNFHRTRQQNVTIRFDQSQRGKCNYNFASTDIPCHMSTQQDKYLLNLSKLRPNEPWGDFYFDILVDNENLDGYNQKFTRNYPEYRLLRIDMPLEEKVAVSLVPDIPKHHFPTPETPDDQDFKSCPNCTYYNEKSASNCSICEGNL